MIVAQVVFPVSSRQIMRGAIAGVLGQMGPITSKLMERLVPDASGSASAPGSPRGALAARAPSGSVHSAASVTPRAKSQQVTRTRSNNVLSMSSSVWVGPGADARPRGLWRRARDRWRWLRRQVSLEEGPGVIKDDHRPIGPVQWELYSIAWPVRRVIVCGGGSRDTVEREGS